jgi:hypothetical protein
MIRASTLFHWKPKPSGIAGATQYAAAQLAYHPALGAPLAGHIYAPWEWLIWQQKFASQAPLV